MAHLTGRKVHYVDVLHYNDLSPSVSATLGLTTKGQLATHNGTSLATLNAGTNGLSLVTDSTQTTGLKYGLPTLSYRLERGSGASVQSIPNNNETNIVFPVVEGTFTGDIPADGMYEVFGQLTFAGNATGTRKVTVGIAGSSMWQCFSAPNATSTTVFFHSWPMQMSTGWTVTLNGLQTSGGSLNVDLNGSIYNSYMVVKRVA